MSRKLLNIVLIAIIIFFSLVAMSSTRKNLMAEKISLLCERVEDLEKELEKQGYKPKSKYRFIRCR